MKQMKTLYLHIGHNKTGSSFIQSSLARSASILADFNIIYPLDENMKAAVKGIVNIGNGNMLHEFFKPADAMQSYLYSSEMIFHKIYHCLFGINTTSSYLHQLKSLIERDTFGTTKVLLFIRNPISMACSKYQQQIKKAGIFITVEDFFIQHDPTPSIVRKVIEYFGNIKNCDIEVINYSCCKDTIQAVSSWLKLPCSLLLPENTMVNRSLSKPELLLQYELNQQFGKTFPPLSDLLVNKLPNVKPSRICPELSIQEAFINRCIEDIEWVNTFVNTEHKYQIDYDTPEPLETNEGLTKEQYRVLAQWIKIFIDEKVESKIKELALIEGSNNISDNLNAYVIINAIKKKIKTLLKNL